MSPAPKSRGDSVFDEPHLRPPQPRENDPVDSVWHEPTRDGEKPAADLPYAAHLRRGIAATSPRASWVLTFALATLAGPLAILSVFLTRAPGFGPLLIVVAGPLIEEIGKILAPLMTVERRPWAFKHSPQILLCALAAGLVFSVIENLLYLHLYIPDPSPLLRLWRWTVCVALHTGCSLLAGIGVMKIHAQTLRNQSPPRLETGAPWILAAAILHGAYNFIALLIDPLFR